MPLPQLPGIQQPTLSLPLDHQQISNVSPTPNLHPQLSLKSLPVRPEPQQPSTPPQQATQKSGRVPFNWNIVAPGSKRASLIPLPSPDALATPRFGSKPQVGPTEGAAEGRSGTNGTGPAVEQGRSPERKMHRAPSRPASQKGLQASRQGSMTAADGHVHVADRLPQLPPEHLEAAKNAGTVRAHFVGIS